LKLGIKIRQNSVAVLLREAIVQILIAVGTTLLGVGLFYGTPRYLRYTAELDARKKQAALRKHWPE